jgi:flagellar motor switch protein FliM
MTDMDVNLRPAPFALSALPVELARCLRQSLEECLRVPALAQAQPPRWIGADELRQIEPTCRFDLLAAARENVAPAHLELSLLLADGVIDLALGSVPQPLGHRRQSLTAVDRQLLHPVMERIVTGLNESLAALSVRLELPGPAGSQPPPVATSEKFLDLTIDIALGQCNGPLRLLLPANLPGLGAEPSSPPPGRDQYIPSDSGGAPSDAPSDIPAVTLAASIEETGHHHDDPELASLATGDLLVTDTPAGGEVIVTVDGQPKFAGQLGQFNGHRAVTITRKLKSQ